MLRSYDAIVVGLGAMGSATLYHLARRGQRVLGIEQFRPNHEMGSSHGDSRIIREQYFEHPLYVPLVQRAYTLWRELEEESGKSLMTITGGLMIGPPDGMVVAGTLRSAKSHGLEHEVLDPDETHRRHPAFSIPEDAVAVVDPRAGFLDPQECKSAHIDGALRAGAEVRYEEPLIEWKPDGEGVRVHTSAGEYLARGLLVAAGAWDSGLLPELKLPLTVERQVAFWFDPLENTGSFKLGRFPIYAYEFSPGILCYGFPRLALGVKASIMHGGETAQSPDKIRRTIDDADADAVRASLRPVLSSLAAAPIRQTGTCLFTNTPDHDFVVDFHPENPQVIVSSACSGHGFKFASSIGELQADLMISGVTSFDITPFRIDRFSGDNSTV